MNLALRIWKALTWKHWVWALGLGVAATLVTTLQTLHLNPHVVHLRVLHHMPWFVGASVIFVVAVGWVEARELGGVPSFWRYAVGAAAASLVWLAAVYLARDYVWMPPTRRVVSDQSPGTRDYRATPKASVLVTNGCEGVIDGWLAMLIYARIRSLRAAREALAEAEMNRARASRELLDMQLRSAQAKAEPAKVLTDLEEIERLYSREPAAAAAHLDNLIAFLRDAIPRLRADDPAPAVHAQGDPR